MSSNATANTDITGMFTKDLLLALLALFLPPLPVMLKCGVCSGATLLDLVLCLFGGIPAVLYAWYIILTHPADGIPFFDTSYRNERLGYERADDESDTESQQQPPPSIEPYNNNSNLQTDPHNGQNTSNGQASTSHPPPYSSVSKGNSPSAPLDNKVQYHDYEV